MLKFPPQYQSKPARKPDPVDQVVPLSYRSMAESTLEWGAKKARGAPAFVPLPAQRTPYAAEPNPAGARAFQHPDLDTGAYVTPTMHYAWRKPFDREVSAKGFPMFDDYHNLGRDCQRTGMMFY